MEKWERIILMLREAMQLSATLHVDLLTYLIAMAVMEAEDHVKEVQEP